MPIDSQPPAQKSGEECGRHICFCGTGSDTPHEIGKCGCVREMTEAPIKTKTGYWFVGGHEITEFTMIQQRGYHQHSCGCWSRSPGSSNSISMDDDDSEPSQPSIKQQIEAVIGEWERLSKTAIMLAAVDDRMVARSEVYDYCSNLLKELLKGWE